MSIAYPITLDQVFTYRLQFPDGGVCEIENNSQYYLYIALGLWANSSDITSQNIAVIPPFQKRAFKATMHGVNPSLSLVPRNIPFAFAANITGSQTVVRISEYADPKAYYPAESFEGIAADYVIIGGGLVQANQMGLFVNDASSVPAFAVIARQMTWDGHLMRQGDVEIGSFWGLGQGIYWDSQLQLLRVAGSISVTGGPFFTLKKVTGTWTVLDATHLQWAGVQVQMIDNSLLTYADGSMDLPGVYYLHITAGGGSNQPMNASTSALSYPNILVGIFFANTIPTEKGTLLLQKGQALIGSQQMTVDKVSAITADLGVMTAGQVIGATIQTDAASIPQVKLDPTGVQILADNQGWVYWKEANSDVTANLLAFDPSPGLADRILTIQANPSKLAIGGNLNLIAYAPLASAPAQGKITITSRNTSSDQVGLTMADNLNNLVDVSIKPGYFRIVSNPANFLQGVIIGGGNRTPGAMLDVVGGGLFTGNLTLPATSGTTGYGLKYTAASIGEIASFQALDFSGTSFLFYTTNRYFDGSNWQQQNTRAGATLQVVGDALRFHTFPVSSNEPTLRFSVSNTGGLQASGGFGCNTKTPQTAFPSGGPAPAGGTGTAAGGYDTAAHRDALISLVNNIRAALVNNGIMS